MKVVTKNHAEMKYENESPNLLQEFDWPSHKAVALMAGSLPMGGVVIDTPIYAFETTPIALALKQQKTPRSTRKNIELGGLLAFEIEDVITSEEADLIVQASERFGYGDAAAGISTPPGMRMNKSVHWVSDESLLGEIFNRISHLLPQNIDGGRLHSSLSHRINMYRYDENDVFNRHTDGDWPGFGLNSQRDQMIEWDGYRSCLTMLLYLNGKKDGVRGGQTRLYRPDRTTIDIEPKKGSALFFRHGHGPGSVIHEGLGVIGKTPKYVARINVLYNFW